MITRIINVESITHDVKRFVMEKPDGYEFKPGQATDVSINRSGWQYKQRPFTFTSLNTDKDLEFIIKGYPLKDYPEHTGVTEELHKLKKGDELRIEKPWGTINYKGKGTFIAGGAGITPFIAIFRQLVKDNEISGNKLLFSNKKREDVILEKELKNSFPNKDLILTLTRDDDRDYEKGRIDGDFIRKHIDNFEENFYVCGPKKMVGEIRKTLSELGASSDTIVFEK